LPKNSVPIIVAAEGPKAAQLAGKIGDGFISTSPNAEFVETFKAQGDNADLPCYCQLTVCFDLDEAKARKIAHKQWPISVIPGMLGRDLPTPKHFEETASLVTEEQTAKEVTCGADPKKHLEATQKYLDAGFPKVSIHNIGPNQKEFMDFYQVKVLPNIIYP
jgi:coenzyme F420-dependent glucose-6-phosphate dehydrogenase